VESKDESSQETPEDSENEQAGDEPDLVETASDETGKRYVPESRFKEVYAKMKDYERAVKQPPQPTELPKQPLETKPLDKTDQVEVELLRATLPQFNPDSPDYSRELDELGFALYNAQPGVTRLAAARKALDMAKQIQSKVTKIEKEAQTEKSIQSDRGITSRVTSRESKSDVPKEDASPEEIEEWLRANGKW
jgi:hypothetical protein